MLPMQRLLFCLSTSSDSQHVRQFNHNNSPDDGSSALQWPTYHTTDPPCIRLPVRPLFCPAVVPPGRYMSQGLVRICPQGFYRETYREFTDPLAQVCVACNPGITTNGAGATSPANCSRVLPGYGIGNVQNVTATDQSNIPGLTVNETTGLPTASVCGLGYYSAGGYCAACPQGTVTRANGSQTIEACGEFTAAAAMCNRLKRLRSCSCHLEHHQRLAAISIHWSGPCLVLAATAQTICTCCCYHTVLTCPSLLSATSPACSCPSRLLSACLWFHVPVRQQHLQGGLGHVL